MARGPSMNRGLGLAESMGTGGQIPILDVLLDTIDGGLSLFGGAVGKTFNAIGEGVNSGISMVSGTISNAVGNALPTTGGREREAPAISAPVIEPAQSVGVGQGIHMSEAALGDLPPPPAFSGGGRSVGGHGL